MVTCTLHLIDSTLSKVFEHHKNENKFRFGKKNIILVGDLLQLAAVSTFEKPVTQLYGNIPF